MCKLSVYSATSRLEAPVLTLPLLMGLAAFAVGCVGALEIRRDVDDALRRADCAGAERLLGDLAVADRSKERIRWTRGAVCEECAQLAIGATRLDDAWRYARCALENKSSSVIAKEVMARLNREEIHIALQEGDCSRAVQITQGLGEIGMSPFRDLTDVRLFWERCKYASLCPIASPESGSGRALQRPERREWVRPRASEPGQYLTQEVRIRERMGEIRAGEHHDGLPIAPTSAPGGGAPAISFSNPTPYNVTVLLAGPTSARVELRPNTRDDVGVKLPAGTYEVAAEVKGTAEQQGETYYYFEASHDFQTDMVYELQLWQ